MSLKEIPYGIFAIFALLIYLWPLGRILRRTGHSGYWALLSFIPFINIVATWIWAYKSWDTEKYPRIDK